jgi:hypothetical protein
MRTIIDQTSGKVLYSIIDEIEIDLMENEVIIYEVVTDEFINPYYNFDQNTFYNVEETVI